MLDNIPFGRYIIERRQLSTETELIHGTGGGQGNRPGAHGGRGQTVHTSTQHTNTQHPAHQHSSTQTGVSEPLSVGGSKPASALVHKTRAGAALVVGAERRLEPDRSTVDLRWPGTGMFRADPQHEPLLVLEALRQTAIYLSHRFHQVPVGHPFILSAIGFELTPQALRTRSGPRRGPCGLRARGWAGPDWRHTAKSCRQGRAGSRR